MYPVCEGQACRRFRTHHQARHQYQYPMTLGVGDPRWDVWYLHEKTTICSTVCGNKHVAFSTMCMLAVICVRAFGQGGGGVTACMVCAVLKPTFFSAWLSPTV
jgi:hypothetical protein